MLISYRPTSLVRHYVYTNVGRSGDQFLVLADVGEGDRLRDKLIGNRSHADVQGKEYCRVWKVGRGRMAWAYYYGTKSGHSAGRAGIVYVVVITAPVWLTWRRGYFSMCLEAVRRAHLWSPDFKDVVSAIESLAVSLNDPTREGNAEFAAGFLNSLHLGLLSWTLFLPRRQSVWQVIRGFGRMSRREFWGRRRRSREAVLICLGGSELDEVELFNRGLDLMWSRRGWRAVALAPEFDSDAVVGLIRVPLVPASSVRFLFRGDGAWFIVGERPD